MLKMIVRCPLNFGILLVLIDRQKWKWSTAKVYKGKLKYGVLWDFVGDEYVQNIEKESSINC